MDDRTEKILDKLDGMADRAARAAYIARLFDYERRQERERCAALLDARAELLKRWYDYYKKHEMWRRAGSILHSYGVMGSAAGSVRGAAADDTEPPDDDADSEQP